MGFMGNYLNQTTKNFIALLFKLALPITLQNFLSSSMTLMDTLMIPFFGMFFSGSIIIGNSIGAGKPDEAYSYGKLLLMVQFSMALIAGGVMILSRGMILSLYNISDIAYMNAYHLMLVSGLALCVKITHFTNVVRN